MKEELGWYHHQQWHHIYQNNPFAATTTITSKKDISSRTFTTKQHISRIWCCGEVTLKLATIQKGTRKSRITFTFLLNVKTIVCSFRGVTAGFSSEDLPMRRLKSLVKWRVESEEQVTFEQLQHTSSRHICSTKCVGINRALRGWIKLTAVSIRTTSREGAITILQKERQVTRRFTTTWGKKKGTRIGKEPLPIKNRTPSPPILQRPRIS